MSDAYQLGMVSGRRWARRGRATSLSHADPIGVVSWIVGQPVGDPEARTWLQLDGAPAGSEHAYARGLAEGNHVERQKMKRGRA